MVLISGGLGYLGGRIAKYLLDSGFQVRIGSSRSHPDVPSDLLSCEIVICDLSDKRSLENACKNVSSIIHLASLNAQECDHDPEAALLINGLGTLNLLNAAKKMGVTKFVYFSTAHVYGSPLQGIIDENSTPRPIHDYAITHRLAEDYVLQANSNKDITGSILRLTNSVGSPLNSKANCWMLVVNDLCKQTVLNQSMELHSDELVQRDFIPISTVCSTVVDVLTSDVLDGEIANVSSGKVLTLRELTNLIADRSEVVLGFRPNINFKRLPKGKPLESLFILNSKLKSSGCIIDTDLSYEIDQLLLNCNQWFAQ
jgi:UDP-glucose 4-epimerase